MTILKFRHILMVTLVAVALFPFFVGAEAQKETKKWERKTGKKDFRPPLLAQGGPGGGLIRISPGIRKIPIAVPLFRVEPDNYSGAAVNAADLVGELLEFTGYFIMLDRNTYLREPRKTGISDQEIDYKSWKMIGADYLITGGIRIKGDTLRIEMWAFDPIEGVKILAKEYAIYYSKEWKADLDKAIRKFCNQFIFKITGSYGIFESKIAFVSNGTGNKEIYICDFDGKNIRQFTKNRSINLSPSWSWDGAWMAYTSFQNGNPDIFIHKYDGKQGRSVSKKGINATPAWTPGKFEMAATLSHEGDQEIYVLTGQGKIIKRLTRDWGIDISPTWSPDGNQIAFTSNRAGNPQIYTMNVNTDRVERLTFEGRYNTEPSWSPKGDKIAYTAMGKDGTHICVIGADGKGLTQLTGVGNNESPTWSPDGSMIAFSSSREGPWRIYVMTSHGTDQRRLFSISGEQTNPSWSPSVVEGK